MTKDQESNTEKKRNIKYFLIMAPVFSVISLIWWKLTYDFALLFGIGWALTLASIVDIIRAFTQDEKPHWIVWVFLFAPIWLAIGFFFLFVLAFSLST